MIIDNELINKIESQAQSSRRLRMNYNIHESLDSKVQRLLNTIMPGSIVPIHRHRNTDETYIILRGCMHVVFYDHNGAQTSRHVLDPAIGNFGVNIPKGQWHGIEVLLPTTIFEVKEGPYQPLQPEDMLD